ncbi:serine hydrolase [Cohnella sp. REN36]|uniref:serine hydrolase n=1 Tax=Cohnella sp. REN36 TaxID=2887347 RepID=UPI001D13C08C|nr:serine hydrolase [Cohnella sp. REN36]MCC3375197.1 serine hydrolase [Cohnella sp. REN36]
MRILPRSAGSSFCRVLATVLSAVLIFPYPLSAASSGPSDSAEAAAFADDFFSRPDIRQSLVGAVVVVVRDDRTLLAKGYGYADATQRTPVDPDATLFRLASLSKTVTAAAVMQQAEQGKVELDRDVSVYLGSLNLSNRTGVPLTLRHLLTHTSGFDRTEAAADEGEPEEVYPLDDFVKDHLPTVVRKPGTAYRYDNYAYDLLGYVVQHVTGQPFGQVVANRIFAPLGMKSSYFALSPYVQRRMATPHDDEGRPLPQYATFPTDSPDGGLISTGADMGRFLRALLNGGRLGGASILTEDSVKEMERRQVSIHPDIPGVGYGFESTYPDLSNGQFVVDKGGVSTGFQSHLWLLPERKTGLFVALNSARDARTIQRELFAAFMNRFYPASAPLEAETTVRQSQAELLRLEGIYRDLRLPMWHYEVEAREGGITVTDGYGAHRLTQEKELLFVDEDGRKAAFKEDEAGRIAYFAYNKADSWAERLPDREQYADVPDDSPYAKPISYARQQGLLDKEDVRLFRPTEPITRAQFVGQLMALAGGPYSESPSAFVDTAGHPYATEIQTALEYGLVTGTNGGRFEPDRPIARQEAAVILARALQLQFGAGGAAPLTTPLRGETAAWAREGVQTIVARGYYGPEVAKDASGAVDYRSKQPMLRQEAAAMFFKFP